MTLVPTHHFGGFGHFAARENWHDQGYIIGSFIIQCDGHILDADDTREGVNAFLEKRDPQWRNK